jgi:hypothetical protein
MDTLRKGYEMNDSLALTKEMGLAILTGLDAEIRSLTEMLEVANRVASETVGFWETRIETYKETRRKVSATRWTE